MYYYLSIMDVLNKLPWDLRIVIVTQFLSFFKLRTGRLMQQLAAEHQVMLQLLLAISGFRSNVRFFDTTGVMVLLQLPENTQESRVLFKVVSPTKYQVDTFVLIDNNNASVFVGPRIHPTIRNYQTGICC